MKTKGFKSNQITDLPITSKHTQPKMNENLAPSLIGIIAARRCAIRPLQGAILFFTNDLVPDCDHESDSQNLRPTLSILQGDKIFARDSQVP